MLTSKQIGILLVFDAWSRMHINSNNGFKNQCGVGGYLISLVTLRSSFSEILKQFFF
jgi:hypothetical protein